MKNSIYLLKYKEEIEIMKNLIIVATIIILGLFTGCTAKDPNESEINRVTDNYFIKLKSGVYIVDGVNKMDSEVYEIIASYISETDERVITKIDQNTYIVKTKVQIPNFNKIYSTSYSKMMKNGIKGYSKEQISMTLSGIAKGEVIINPDFTINDYEIKITKQNNGNRDYWEIPLVNGTKPQFRY